MKIFKRLFLILILIILITGTVIILNGYKLYKTTLDGISLSDKVAEIKSIDTYVSIKDVPEYYINAVIAVEDHRFRNHGAIDIISIGRAIISNIKAKDFNEGRKHYYSTSC